MTNILPAGTDSRTLQDTINRGPVTAGDTTTEHLTATATTEGNQHQSHQATLTALLGSRTRRRLTNTGRALAVTVSLVSTTL